MKRKDTEINTAGGGGGGGGRDPGRSGGGASLFALFRAFGEDHTCLSPKNILGNAPVSNRSGSSALVDGHGGHDRLDVANVGQLELEIDDVGALVAQLVVHALLEPRCGSDEMR